MKKLTTFSIATILLASCSDFRAGVQDMQDLARKIKHDLNVQNISVNIPNDTTLNITIGNSAYYESTDQRRQGAVDTISAICADYCHRHHITAGRVKFTDGDLEISSKESYQLIIKN